MSAPTIGRIIKSTAGIGDGRRGVVHVDPMKLLVSKVLIQADSGGGKSYAFRRLLEQLYGQLVEWVIDPEGEFGTLREIGDFVIVGGEHGDIPADIRVVDRLARHLLELKVNVIFDLYDLPPMVDARTKSRITRGEIPDPTRHGYVGALLTSLLGVPKSLWTPMVVAVDECQEFAPEGGKDVASLAPIATFNSQCRKRSMGFIPATNRAGRISKDAIAGIRNYMIGSSAMEVDNKRAAKYLGFGTAGADELKRGMEPGEFFVVGPAFGSREVVKIMVAEVKTSHPQPNKPVPVVPAPPDRIQKVLAGLRDIPKQAKAEKETLEGLRAEIATLKQELKMALKKVQVEVEVEEKFVFRKGEVEKVGHLVDKLDRFIKARSTLADQEAKALQAAALELQRLQAQLATAKGDPAPSRPAPRSAPQHVRSASPGAPGEPPKVVVPTGDVPIDARHRLIVSELAYYAPAAVEHKAIAALAGYTPGSRSYLDILRDLRRAGVIHYGDGATIEFQKDSMPNKPGPAGGWDMRQHLDHWKRSSTLLDDRHRKILTEIVDRWEKTGSEADHNEVATATDYTPGSRSFLDILRDLRRFGAINYGTNGSVSPTSFLTRANAAAA